MVPLHQCIPAGVAALLRAQPLSPAKVGFTWRVAVGPAIDRASRVTLREDGALEVAVKDALWRREVERSRALVLARMETLLGAGVVKRLIVRSHGRPEGLPHD